jgi:type I restriction enzyme S subunit
MIDSNNPWLTRPLAEIASEMCLGKMLDKKKNRGTLLPYLRNVNVRWFTFDLTDMKEMRFEESEGTRFDLREGDLVICEGGEPGRAAVWRGQSENAKIQKALHRVRFRSDLYLPHFAMYYLYFGTITNRFASYYTGTTIKHLTGTSLSKVSFPIPPLNEQRRIVAKIEELFSDLDAGVAALNRAKANLKRYRAAVLKAAVEGKLTEEWRAKHPNAEPASKLLERVASPPRPARYNSRSVDVIPGHAALSVGATGAKLPAGWAWSALVDIAKMESGHTPSRNHPEWWDGDVRWIGILDAKAHHGGVIHETLQHTNEDGLANSASRLLPVGTICISRTAASIGYVCVLGRPMATSQDFVNWIPTDAVTSNWLRLVFMVDREVLIRFGKGSTHKTVYYPEWLSMHVAVPPLEEQEQIVCEVDLRQSQIAIAERQVMDALLRGTRLRQSILKQAFEGKLVPHDPTDEPASMLLERICTAKAVAPKPAERKSRTPRKGKST